MRVNGWLGKTEQSQWQRSFYRSQGGPIGRISAYWEIVNFGQLLKITEVFQIFGYFFPQ
jgi:hypothetical protein